MKSAVWRILGLPVWHALNRTLKAWNWDLTNYCGKANARCNGPEYILWIGLFLSTVFASTGLPILYSTCMPACIPFHACTHPTNPIMNWDHTNSHVMYMQVQLPHPFLILCGKQLYTFSNREFKVIFSAVMVPGPNGGYITCTLIPQGKLTYKVLNHFADEERHICFVSHAPHLIKSLQNFLSNSGAQKDHTKYDVYIILVKWGELSEAYWEGL